MIKKENANKLMAAKKSIFDRAIFSSKVKSANVKSFPETLFGYFAGPLYALIPNAIISTFLTQYRKNEREEKANREHQALLVEFQAEQEKAKKRLEA